MYLGYEKSPGMIQNPANQINETSIDGMQYTLLNSGTIDLIAMMGYASHILQKYN